MFKKFGRWLIALMGLVPVLAFADTSGPFTVNNSDISLKILSQIFGGLTPLAGDDAFKSAITTFNGAVLIVGGILATYTLLAGTLGTAHDGEMLGKKFSSVWIPIRYALGTALVLPVLNGGYCVMQQLVMWCILQGVGLANTVWIAYLQSPTLMAPVTMTTSHKQEVLVFARNVALAQICTQANAIVLNEGNTAGGLIDKISKSVMTFDYKVAYSTDGTKAYFGDQHGKLAAISKSACGDANLPKKPVQTINQNGAASGGKLGDISSAFQLADISPVYQAHIDQSKKLITDMGVLAKTAVTNDAAFPDSEVKKAADAYVVAIENVANNYTSGNKNPFKGIVDASQTQGWILAGAWFTKLAMVNQNLSDAVNSVPTASFTWQLGSGFKFLDAVQPKISAARSEILEAMNVSVPDSDSDEKDSAQGKQTQNSGVWSRIIQSVVEVFTGLDLEKLQSTDKHPVLVLQDAGNRMISAWATAATALMTTLAIIGGVQVFGTGFNATPLILTFIGFAFVPIAGLVTLGFTLAYLLPNLPFLMWIGIVLGWLIMCVEAILAAPLWAVMHLHPNGDDLTGRGGNGYMLLLGLLLRPALTIFGLIAALVLTEIMGEFVNKIFFAVFFSGTGTGLITILSVVFCMTVYTSAMVQLFRKTFSLMHVIPDQLMRWIGGGQEQMGQYAGGLAEAGQKGVQAAGQAGSFLGERSAQTASTLINQGKQIKDANNANKAREAAMKNEENSQLESFSNSGMNQGEQESMQQRTKDEDKNLKSAHPQSKAGIELAQSKGKMLKSRNEGEAKVGQAAGAAGQSKFMEALGSGQFQVGVDNNKQPVFRNVGSMAGNNAYEKEANFASFVSNAIVLQSSEKREQEAQSQQNASANRHDEQMGVLNDIKGGLNNGGKIKDSSSTPQGGESISNGGVRAKPMYSTQPGLFDQTQGELFGNQHDNIVNNAFQTDKDGNLLNPALAQTLASSGVVNAAGRGLNANSASIIQQGGTTRAPVQTPIDPSAMSAESRPTPSISDFTPEVNPRSGQIESGVDSSTSAQFQLPGFDSTNTEGLSPSQSFDGSGGSQTGSTPPISDIDR